jgi:hypothetical protein
MLIKPGNIMNFLKSHIGIPKIHFLKSKLVKIS